MACNPTEYTRITNKLGQEVVFYEHPSYGDEYPVIAVIHEYKVAVCTDFYDTDDMVAEHGEYTPAYMHGEVACQWEFDIV